MHLSSVTKTAVDEGAPGRCRDTVSTLLVVLTTLGYCSWTILRHFPSFPFALRILLLSATVLSFRITVPSFPFTILPVPILTVSLSVSGRLTITTSRLWRTTGVGVVTAAT